MTRAQHTAVSPEARDLEIIESLRRFMDAHETEDGTGHGEAAPAPTWLLGVAGAPDRVELPESLYAVLKQAVEVLHRGQSVTLAARDEEITTQQAGELLGISRPTVVELIRAGELPCHVPGTSRRKLFLSDVMAYRDEIQARRNAFIATSSEQYADVDQDDIGSLLDEARKAR